jgi:uncharacterized protein (DUF2147 family)
MRRILVTAAALGFGLSVAFAAEPTGEWLVADGDARIRIEKCGERYWGVVSWERKPGVDTNNPDPAKRGRPTLGMPVLLGMAPVEANRWNGQVYNSENGKTYTAHISLSGPDTLNIEGCILGGLLCGSQKWARAPIEMPAAGSTAGAKPGTGTANNGARPGTATGPVAGARPATATGPVAGAKPGTGARPLPAPPVPSAPDVLSATDVCSRVTGAPGSSHEDRLKQDSGRHGADQRQRQQFSHTGSSGVAR